MVRLIRWLRAALELVITAWSAYQAGMLVLEWLGAQREQAEPGTYPNEWGVRTTPLEPPELEIALEEERAIARRLAGLVADGLGSPATGGVVDTAPPAATPGVDAE